MIVSDSKKEVINNIEKFVENQQYNQKVETDDPEIPKAEEEKLIEDYLKNKDKLLFKIKDKIAQVIVNVLTREENKATKIIGIENLKKVKGGAIITSNHCNPLDSIPIRKAVKMAGKKPIKTVIQITNLAMEGLHGFIMNHIGTIPLSYSASFVKKIFPTLIKEELDKGRLILIYPEQEMWFNYKKPRTPKPGAYYYAAKFNAPIISCFLEIVEKEEKDNDEFNKTEYVLHILKPIYPDENKTTKENTREMMHKDYEQKKEAYEKAYGKKLSYEFEIDDIAGWINK